MHNAAPKTTNTTIAGIPDKQGMNSSAGVPLADDIGITAAEFLSIKDEKLAVIRRALERGDYDSDEILEKALDRMLERLEESEVEQK